MSQFYDDNNELNIYYPVNSPQTYNLEDDFENIQTITPLIENQIRNLNDLTHTYDFNIYSPYLTQFIADQLDYINSNYFYLHNFDNIIENDIQSRIIFSYLYELITLDLLTKIIPQIFLADSDLKLNDLLLIDEVELKQKIFKVLHKQLSIFNKLKKEITTSRYKISDFEYQSLKYTYYLDLFDSDLSGFNDNVLSILLIKYKDLIESFITI